MDPVGIRLAGMTTSYIRILSGPYESMVFFSIYSIILVESDYKRGYKSESKGRCPVSNEWLRKPTSEPNQSKPTEIKDYQSLVEEYLENVEENKKILVISEEEENVFFLVFPQDDSQPFTKADFALLTKEGHYAFVPSDMAYRLAESYLEYLSLLADAEHYVNGEEA